MKSNGATGQARTFRTNIGVVNPNVQTANVTWRVYDKNNNLVGPDRIGPRNQRRTPFASNTPFYPNMMWNGRFAAISGVRSVEPLSTTTISSAADVKRTMMSLRSPGS